MSNKPDQTEKSIFMKGYDNQGRVVSDKDPAAPREELPKLQGKKYEDETLEQSIEIVVPAFNVVNQRIFCIMGTNKIVKNPKTGLFEPQFTKIARKDGTVTTLPRLFVAKCAPDIFIETNEGRKHIYLEPGTEVFPFWPDMEGFTFPTVKDPITLIEYTVIHWTELAAYNQRKE